MRKIKRFAIFLVIVFLAAVAGFKWWVRTDRGEAWVRRRLSNALAMPVSFDSADLVWPGRLALRRFRVAPEPDEGDAALSAYEVFLGRIPGRRGTLVLRRPELVLPAGNAERLPAGWTRLGALGDVRDREAFEKLSKGFRDDWDVTVRDGRVKSVDASGRVTIVIDGFDWQCRRVRVTDRRGWHNRLILFAGEAGGDPAADPVVMEWLSLENAGIVPLPTAPERGAGRFDRTGAVGAPEAPGAGEATPVPASPDEPIPAEETGENGA